MDAGPRLLFDAGPRLVVDSGPGRDSGTGGGVDSGPGSDAGGTDAGGPACPESPCRLVAPQCGCPGDQGCYIDTSDQRACGARGPEREGQACSGPTACQAGLMCLGSGGFCARFCDSDADCSGAGSICGVRLLDASGAPIPNVTLCSISCDPLTGSGCPSGQGCAILQEQSGAMRGFTICRAEGPGTAGSPCFTEEDCRTGHICADAGFGDECIQLCTSDFDCGILELCNPFSPRLTVSGTEWGYCY